MSTTPRSPRMPLSARAPQTMITTPRKVNLAAPGKSPRATPRGTRKGRGQANAVTKAAQSIDGVVAELKRQIEDINKDIRADERDQKDIKRHLSLLDKKRKHLVDGIEERYFFI